MKYTNKQQIEMYLEWFNNYLSTTKFREDYNLGMAECENILDNGRDLNEAIATANKINNLTTKQQTTMKNLREEVENAIIREQIGDKGGGVEIDLGVFSEEWDGQLMSAYQNYLGGGMLGSIQNDCTIDNWDNTCIVGGYDLKSVGEELKRYMHDKTNPDDDVEGSSYDDNQKRSASAY